MRNLIFGFGILVTAIACSPKTTPAPTPTPIDTAEATMSTEASAGKTIYSKKCTKCHAAKIIDNFSEQQWAGILPGMAGKAELDEAQTSQVAAYVAWELEH